MPLTLTATPKASELVAQLFEDHGALSFHFTGRIGGALCCLPKGELRIGGHDVLMGRFGDAPVYMRSDDAKVWEGCAMVIALTHGHPRGFSLESGCGYRFVLRPAAPRE